MTVLGLRFSARAFSSCGKWGPLFITVRGPLTIAASLVAEHRLQTRRLSNCGSWSQLLRGMWDLPRPGLEPVSPCIGRQILNHCATREALICDLKGSLWLSCGGKCESRELLGRYYSSQDDMMLTIFSYADLPSIYFPW